MLLKNNTGNVSKIGYLVKADDKDRTAFVYADANSTNILGVITQTVPKYGLCEIVNSGTAKIYISERVLQGTIIRAQKSGDRIGRGTCRGVKNTDKSYIQIGTALESGKGLIRVALSIISGTPTTYGAVPDGTYTIGLGIGSDGVVVIQNGIITSITEAT